MQQERPQTKQSSGDVVFVHAHIFCPQGKAAGSLDLAAQIARSSKLAANPPSSRDQATIDEYAQSLSQARSAALQQLQRSTSTDAESSVDDTATRYVALLLGLVSCERSGSPDVSAGLTADAPLRRSIAYPWQDTLLTPSQSVSAADSVFELASFLVAWALWQMRSAASLCQPGSAGVSSETATTAYKLLRAAAGKFEFVKDRLLNLLQGPLPSTDCNFQALAAYSALCLADAQSITVLRAIQKGNQPSLISGLASDTALLYQSAAELAQSVPYTAGDLKCVTYAQYKAATFRAYAHGFAGQALAQDGQAGQAVRCLTAAQPLATHAGKGATAYDRALPTTPAADRKFFDADLTTFVETTLGKVKRENDVVYYQRVTDEIPLLPEAKRLVTPVTYALPAHADAAKAEALQRAPEPPPGPAPAVEATPSRQADSTAGAGEPQTDAAADGEQGGEGASCWRWLLVIIAMPFLLALTLVGAIIWIILLPVKIICCPLGCLVQIIWNVVEYVLKAPFRAILWASGKPWKAKKPGKVSDVEKGHAR